MFESQLYDENSFITLTFDDDHLDPIASLRKEDFQKFMKRLRKRTGANIRYFHCGEYGEQTARPHHHAIIFGYRFPDRVCIKDSNGFKLYRSPLLEKCWTFGNSVVADVSFETCAYVARYVMKKITGEFAKDHYGDRVPDYCTMSRRPAIGRNWIETYESDVYPKDRCVVREGIIGLPPKYFDKWLEENRPEMFRAIKKARILSIDTENNSANRLRVREAVASAKVKLKKREI